MTVMKYSSNQYSNRLSFSVSLSLLEVSKVSSIGSKVVLGFSVYQVLYRIVLLGSDPVSSITVDSNIPIL